MNIFVEMFNEKLEEMEKLKRSEVLKEFRKQIIIDSNDRNISPLLLITKMQMIAAQNKDEDILDILCELKWEFIPKK